MSETNVHELLSSEVEGMALLAAISQDFATSLDIDETLHNAIRQIMVYLNAEAASIFLLGDGERELICRACAGPVKITGITVNAGEGIIGKAIRENQVQIVRDVREDPDFTQSVDDKTGFTTRSILCAPLRVKDKRIGALELINKKTSDGLFDAKDQHLLTALASSASLAIHNAAMAMALVEQERMRKELELAGEIQRSLLPAVEETGCPVHGLNIPAREVSGDFYDYFTLKDGRIYFNLADVSGKGMNAALLMAKTSSLFHCLGKNNDSPGELLAQINDEVYENRSRGMFVTMVGGIYDPDNGRITLSNAGHQPPLYIHDGNQVQAIPGSAPPLGILPGITFPESTLELNGGSLYLFTDGLTEARMNNGTELGIEGVVERIRRKGDLPAGIRLRGIVDDILQSRHSIHDDVTLLLVEAP